MPNPKFQPSLTNFKSPNLKYVEPTNQKLNYLLSEPKIQQFSHLSQIIC
jgi:hypothetical protein